MAAKYSDIKFNINEIIHSHLYLCRMSSLCLYCEKNFDKHCFSSPFQQITASLYTCISFRFWLPSDRDKEKLQEYCWTEYVTRAPNRQDEPRERPLEGKRPLHSYTLWGENSPGGSIRTVYSIKKVSHGKNEIQKIVESFKVKLVKKNRNWLWRDVRLLIQ